jgi:hypothetical protein
MKQQCAFLFVILLLRIPVIAQPCIPQGITFNTQAQIDSFPITHPNCSEIQGIVYITGNDITNLNGLSSIVSVGSDLYIRNTSSLMSLSGLNNLTSVGNELSIGNNALLNSLEGLGGLEFVGYALELDINPSLNNLNGLNSLTYIGGYLLISGNGSLVNLTGLDSLGSVGSGVNITGNSLLNNLSGLNNLNSTGGGLMLTQNYSLTSLEGLSNLSMIGGTLWINDNNSLHSLIGLDNITANSITDLTISDNDSLSTCEILSVCSYLSSLNGNVIVQNNSAGCNNETEIESACQSISTLENEESGSFLIYPNPANQMISIPSGYKGKIMGVNFYNENGFRLLNIHPGSESIDVSLLPKGFYIAEFLLKNETILRKKLVIKNNREYFPAMIKWE